MKKTGKLLLVFLLTLFVTMTPVIVSANSNAKTLKELRNELQQLKNKKAQQDANKNATKSKINNAKNDIGNKRTEIETNTKDIADATAESEELTVEIEEGKEKLDKLMSVYQIASENNTYLEYIFDSKTYDDLVYRSALSEQLMDYINESIESWNDKIEKNDALKVELAEKSKQLESDISSLSSSIDQWGTYLNKLEEGSVSIKEDISSTEELIKYYTSIGCGENEDLEKCASVKGDTRFIRPLKKGTLTS